MSDETAGTWVVVGPVQDIPEAAAHRATVADTDILVYRSGDRVFAVGNRCTHMGAPLHEGTVKAAGSLATVTCPLHGSMFGLADGRVLRGPAVTRLPAFEARVQDGQVEVRALA